MLIKTGDLEEYDEFFPALDRFLAQYNLVAHVVTPDETAKDLAAKADRFLLDGRFNTESENLSKAIALIHLMRDALRAE